MLSGTNIASEETLRRDSQAIVECDLEGQQQTIKDIKSTPKTRYFIKGETKTKSVMDSTTDDEEYKSLSGLPLRFDQDDQQIGIEGTTDPFVEDKEIATDSRCSGGTESEPTKIAAAHKFSTKRTVSLSSSFKSRGDSFGDTIHPSNIDGSRHNSNSKHELAITKDGEPTTLDPSLIMGAERTLFAALNNAWLLSICGVGFMSLGNNEQHQGGIALLLFGILSAVLAFSMHFMRMTLLKHKKPFELHHTLLWAGAIAALTLMAFAMELYFGTAGMHS